MTIHSGKMAKPAKIQIDLRGPEGNAFCLMAYASDIGKQIGMEKDEIEAIIADMKSRNYDHLVATFDRHFGDFVDIYAGDD